MEGPPPRWFSPPPFLDPPEVEAAMMRGNAEVGPHRGRGGHLEGFSPPRAGPPGELSLRGREMKKSCFAGRDTGRSDPFVTSE
jgi:hypothetical protein